MTISLTLLVLGSATLAAAHMPTGLLADLKKSPALGVRAVSTTCILIGRRVIFFGECRTITAYNPRESCHVHVHVHVGASLYVDRASMRARERPPTGGVPAERDVSGAASMGQWQDSGQRLHLRRIPRPNAQTGYVRSCRNPRAALQSTAAASTTSCRIMRAPANCTIVRPAPPSFCPACLLYPARPLARWVPPLKRHLPASLLCHRNGTYSPHWYAAQCCRRLPWLRCRDTLPVDCYHVDHRLRQHTVHVRGPALTALAALTALVALAALAALPFHAVANQQSHIINQNGATSGFELCFAIESQHQRCWGQNTSPAIKRSLESTHVIYYCVSVCSGWLTRTAAPHAPLP